MEHDLDLGIPQRPGPPNRIPAVKAAARVVRQWKALSGKVKVGVVVGGVLSLAAVGAMANPLTSAPSPRVPLVSASTTSVARSTTVTKAATASLTPATVPSASVSPPPTPSPPATTAPAAPTTTAAAAPTAKTATAAAPKTTAVKATTTKPVVQATVTPGAYCSGAGRTGVTSTGKAMVCKVSATDTRLRWRAA